jgi:VanZ family protein
VEATGRIRTSSIIRWGVAIAWMAAIFCMSAQSSLPGMYERFENVLSVAGHLIEYAALALFLWWAVRGQFHLRGESRVRHAAAWAFVIAVAFGFSDEIHQYFVPGRHMDPLDWLTDAIGAAMALWIVSRVVKCRADAPPANGRDPVDST